MIYMPCCEAVTSKCVRSLMVYMQQAVVSKKLNRGWRVYFLGKMRTAYDSLLLCKGFLFLTHIPSRRTGSKTQLHYGSIITSAEGAEQIEQGVVATIEYTQN